ncbi:MAG: hypothetical protein AAFN78_04120 [Pseudomonadota bacterium]
MDANWVIDVMRRFLSPGFTLDEARKIFRDEGWETDPASIFFAPEYGSMSRVILKNLKIGEDHVPAILHVDLEPHQAINLPRIKAALGTPVESPRMKPSDPRCFQIDIEPGDGRLGGDLAMEILTLEGQAPLVTYLRFQRRTDDLCSANGEAAQAIAASG